MDLELFRQKPLIGILRGVTRGQLAPTLESAVAGGLEALEITMNTAGAAQLIAQARDAVGGQLAIGAGTVLTLKSLEAALDAGASFIVMPTLVDEVVAECVRRGVPVFPGALTPQEIHAAWLAGAAMVKVFPAKFFGPEYFREVKGPFDDVLLLACGGVSAESLHDYAACGADAYAFGGSVFNPAWIEAGDFDKVEDGVRALVDAHASFEPS
jgi:2-dehydro-3-deoxyphosphogluconate aldolase/(4S)-4-hydroxy-2-oxoglutarate aldolase